MVSKSWTPDRREWHLQWKSGGSACHLRVRVADLGGGKRAEEAAAAIAAETVSEFLRISQKFPEFFKISIIEWNKFIY